MAENGEVRFVITGDASGLAGAAAQGQSALRDLKQTVDSVQASAERMETATRQAGRAVQGVAFHASDLSKAHASVASETEVATARLRAMRDASDRLEKAAAVLSPRMQGLFTSTKNLSEAAGGLNPRVIAMGAAAGAAVAGVVALTASVAALGAGIVSVIASADDYAKSLTEWDRRAYDEQVSGALAAQQAISGMMEELRVTALVVAAEFAPGIEAVAFGVRGAAVEFREIAKATRQWTQAISGSRELQWALEALAFITGQQGLLRSMRDFKSGLEQVGRTDAKWDEWSRQLEAFDAGLLDAEGMAKRQAEEAARWAATEADLYGALGLTGEATSKVTQETTRRSDAATTAAKAIRAQTAAEAAILTLLRQQAATRAAGLNAPNLGALNAAGPSLPVGPVAGAADGIAQANANAAGETRESWQDAFGAIGQGATQLTGILSAGFADLSQSTTASAREAAKKQFAITKASALVQATMQTALAVVSALATTGGLGYAAAAISGAAGAAQIAFIAAQKMPSFHRGGIRQLAPDEQVAPPAVVRTNEASVVMTRDAMRTMGGADGIARMNAGLGGAQGGGSVYLVLDDGGLARARPLARPSMGLGRSRR